MKFQTNIPLQEVSTQFDYEDKILLLGSCFSENIGKRLAYYKFQSITNPFGILFNPVSIATVIEAAVHNKTFTEVDVFKIEGVWKSFVAHSDLNALNRLQAVINLQEAQQQLREQLQTASHLFITLGTSWVYRHIESDSIVANCHKVPQKEFSKELLSVDAVTQSLSKTITLIKGYNPNINITFTISPVRHLKDGFIENTQSKSHLITAVHQLVNDKNILYFPAYEIMMDELRDYRFYTLDMLHPSGQAIDYIWGKFMEVYTSAKAKNIAKEVHAIQKGLKHRPFNAESDNHQLFVQKLQMRIHRLQQEYQHMVFNTESEL